ncbi:MAG: toll/interleukin-1 receptor domain-containing protein [Verrucomicrobiia bacterium]
MSYPDTPVNPYSEYDREFADRLHADLQNKRVRCWLFSEDAKWGEAVWGGIDRGIKYYDKLVVVCSENSLQSPAVLREIERGLQREDREKKNVLFPITIDDYIFDKWDHPRKADVLSKVGGDFRQWNDPAYQKSLARLLKHLQATDSKTA